MWGCRRVAGTSRLAYITVMGASLKTRVMWMTYGASSSFVAFSFVNLVDFIIVTVTTTSLGDRRRMVRGNTLAIVEKYWQIIGIWMWFFIRSRGRVCRSDGSCAHVGFSRVEGAWWAAFSGFIGVKMGVDIIVTSRLLGLLLTGHIKGRMIGLLCRWLFLHVDNGSLNRFHDVLYV